MVHVINYGGGLGGRDAVRVAGRYRSRDIWASGQRQEHSALEMLARRRRRSASAAVGVYGGNRIGDLKMRTYSHPKTMAGRGCGRPGRSLGAASLTERRRAWRLRNARLRRGTAARHAEDVRPVGRPGAAGQRQDCRDKINLTGAPTYRLGYLPLEDTHYTHPQVIAAVGPPDGQGRRPPHPHAGKPLVHCRSGRGVHAAGQLGAARHPRRRAEGGVREHQFPGARPKNIRACGAARRPHLPGLRPEPFLRRLRRFRHRWPR